MRKEVLLAVIFGIILGGVILYGINLANKSVSNTKPVEKTTESPISPAPTTETKSLSIISPSNHTVTTEKIATLTGKAIPGSNIAIIGEADDLLIEAGSDGTFSAKINLIGGENTITVTELLPDNTTVKESITIIQTATLPE